MVANSSIILYFDLSSYHLMDNLQVAEFLVNNIFLNDSVRYFLRLVRNKILKFCTYISKQFTQPKIYIYIYSVTNY